MTPPESQPDAERPPTSSDLDALFGAETPAGETLLLGRADGPLGSRVAHGLVAAGERPMLDAARARRLEVIESSGPPESWVSGLGERRFERIVVDGVLEATSSPGELLRRLGAHLADGGSIYVRVPNAAHVSVAARLLEGRLDPVTFPRPGAAATTLPALRDLVEAAGLRITRIVRETRVPDLDDRETRLSSIASRNPEAWTGWFSVALRRAEELPPSAPTVDGAGPSVAADLPFARAPEWALLEQENESLSADVIRLGRETSALRRELADERRLTQRLHHEVANRQRWIDAVEGTKLWRLRGLLRRLLRLAP